MNCRTYIFTLTSGQLAQAGLHLKLQAAVHRFICTRCRRFSRNDQLLQNALQAQRQHMLNEINPPNSTGGHQ